MRSARFRASSTRWRYAIAESRAGEASAGAPARLVLFEPGITWSDTGQGAPPDFARDSQVVYSPHIYQGGLNSLPLDESSFQQALDEAATYGGAPVVVGEWGSDPSRAADPSDGYFDTHQSLQERFRFGATLWTWREACGDPHKAADWVAGRIPSVWGFFDVDCASNTILGMRAPLAAALTRGYLRAAPGRLASVAFDPGTGALAASGDAAARTSFVAFLPPGGRDAPWLEGSRLEFFSWKAAPGGGLYVTGFVPPGPWTLSLHR